MHVEHGLPMSVFVSVTKPPEVCAGSQERAIEFGQAMAVTRVERFSYHDSTEKKEPRYSCLEEDNGVKHTVPGKVLSIGSVQTERQLVSVLFKDGQL